MARSTASPGVCTRNPSARDATGTNLALLACRAFAVTAPIARQTWRLHLDGGGVRAMCEFPERRLAFDRHAFARDPRIATLQWER